MLPTRLAATIASALALAVVTTATAAQTAELAPTRLDLGERACRSVVRTTAWLVNTSDRPLTVTDVTADCLYVDAGLGRPGPLAPGRAAPIDVAVRVPDQPGAARTWTITVTLEGGDPLALPVRVVPTEHEDPFVTTTDDTLPLRFVPSTIDFGTLEINTSETAEVWLVNASDSPRALVLSRTTCGCVELIGFEPGQIEPHEARRLQVRVTAPAQAGKTKRQRARTFAKEGDEAVLTLWLESAAPLIARLDRYRDARQRGDADAQRALLSDDSRIWFEQREGPGTPRTVSGDGPWSAWDREMGSSSTVESVDTEWDTVTKVVAETNDYYRLLDRKPARIRLTYWFDGDRRIEGFLVQGIDDGEPDGGSREAFLEWARRHHRDEIDSLLDGDRVVPSAANARRWRALLLEWRREAGLSIPRMPEWEARLDRSLQTYLTASDFRAASDALADGFRLWFDRREGPGMSAAEMRGLFEWDRACAAELEQRELTFEGDRAIGVFHETNEFARLLGFPGWTARVTFWFDEHARIAGQLYEPLPGPSFEEAFAPALRWLQANRPHELAAVYVDGRIVHSAESAERWLQLLREWRELGVGD
jgi:hypothetical protein